MQSRSGLGLAALAALLLVEMVAAQSAPKLDGRIVGVTLSATEVAPKEIFKLIATVENTGQMTAVYHVYASTSANVIDHVSDGIITLVPGQQGSVMLTFRVRAAAHPGTYAG